MYENVIEILKCTKHVIIIHHLHHSQNVHKKKKEKNQMIISPTVYDASAPCDAWQSDT